ncbi:MAG: fumarylacetoacetate hydrolase, partial [Candidatus Puniceispirillaceae bacterium]
MLPADHTGASLVGRVWNPEVAGPSLVRILDDLVFDITTPTAPTMRDLLELDDNTAHALAQSSTRIAVSLS